MQKKAEKEWEHSRDKRVKNWRNFKDVKRSSRKKGKFEIHAPAVKMEERPEYAPRAEGKPMGIIEDYKKLWR